MRAYLAEVIGTFALVFFGSVSVTIFGAIATGSVASSILAIALTHGIVLMVMVYSIGHISGCHINPAVTVAMWSVKKIKTNIAAGYIVSQLIGASLAALVHMLILPQGALVFYGATLPSNVIANSAITALAIEAILTFFLVFVIFSTTSRNSEHAGLAIGLTLTAGILIGGILTGAALNPARAFGPALVSGNFSSHWVYWIGPMIGGLGAAVLHRKAFLKKK